MATRFGASSPAKAYQTKVKWLVSGLVAVILVLIITLFYVAQGSAPTNDPANAGQAFASTSGNLSPTVDILVATRRIEEGEQITDGYIANQPVAVEKVPDGTFQSHEKALLVGKFSTAVINANAAYLKAAVSDAPPLDTIPIPPGYRAVTIEVNKRSSVEGWAKPNTRVDVLWTYAEGGSKKVATIVRFAKVLSVGGQTANTTAGQPSGGKESNTVTLLVTEREAKKIELARNLGEISLSLVGQNEEIGSDDGTEIVDINSILGIKSDVVEQTEEPADGVMYSNDGSGKKVRYLLRKGKWVKDPDY